jgi:hypothetical protein
MHFLVKVHNVLAVWCSSKAPDFYSGCSLFGSWSEHRLSRLSFPVGFLRHTKKVTRIYVLKPKSFPSKYFSVHYSQIILLSKVHRPSYWQRRGTTYKEDTDATVIPTEPADC